MTYFYLWHSYECMMNSYYLWKNIQSYIDNSEFENDFESRDIFIVCGHMYFLRGEYGETFIYFRMWWVLQYWNTYPVKILEFLFNDL